MNLSNLGVLLGPIFQRVGDQCVPQNKRSLGIFRVDGISQRHPQSGITSKKLRIKIR